MLSKSMMARQGCIGARVPSMALWEFKNSVG